MLFGTCLVVTVSFSYGAGVAMAYLPPNRLNGPRPARVTPRKDADLGYLAHPLGPYSGLTIVGK